MAASQGAENSQDSSILMKATLYGIRKAFPNVRQMDTSSLENFIQGNGHRNLILLDVRGKDEFEVSHLCNAIQVEPDEPVYQVIAKINQSLEGIPDKKVKIVCYCSVGYRSSSMAQKLYNKFKHLKETQKIDATSELWNLEGSIFKWANEGKELVTCNNARTQYCHPYNFLWGKLLEEKFRAYEPVLMMGEHKNQSQ